MQARAQKKNALAQADQLEAQAEQDKLEAEFMRSEAEDELLALGLRVEDRERNLADYIGEQMVGFGFQGTEIDVSVLEHTAKAFAREGFEDEWNTDRMVKRMRFNADQMEKTGENRISAAGDAVSAGKSNARATMFGGIANAALKVMGGADFSGSAAGTGGGGFHAGYMGQ